MLNNKYSLILLKQVTLGERLILDFFCIYTCRYPSKDVHSTELFLKCTLLECKINAILFYEIKGLL